jgi:hypothetical protein
VTFYGAAKAAPFQSLTLVYSVSVFVRNVRLALVRNLSLALVNDLV